MARFARAPDVAFAGHPGVSPTVRMRGEIASLAMRAAAAVGGAAQQPGRSIIASLVYRLAGAVVAL
jgi:hypothetical protein